MCNRSLSRSEHAQGNGCEETGKKLKQQSPNMESAAAGNSAWGQLTFTHESRLPVIITKDSLSLGRREGNGIKISSTTLSLE